LYLIVQVLSRFQPSPATTARFGAMFATLTTQMVTHDISLAGVIPQAAVKSTPPFTGTKPRTALHQVSNKHGQCKRLERDPARGGGSDARGGGGGGRQAHGGTSTGPTLRPSKSKARAKLLTTTLSANLVIHTDICL